jgi:hypothetical protein
VTKARDTLTDGYVSVAGFEARIAALEAKVPELERLLAELRLEVPETKRLVVDWPPPYRRDDPGEHRAI